MTVNTSIPEIAHLKEYTTEDLKALGSIPGCHILISFVLFLKLLPNKILTQLERVIEKPFFVFGYISAHQYVINIIKYSAVHKLVSIKTYFFCLNMKDTAGKGFKIPTNQTNVEIEDTLTLQFG